MTSAYADHIRGGFKMLDDAMASTAGESEYTMDRGEWRIPAYLRPSSNLERRTTRLAYKKTGSLVDIYELRLKDGTARVNPGVFVELGEDVEEPSIVVDQPLVKISLDRHFEITMTVEQSQEVARLLVSTVGMGE